MPSGWATWARPPNCATAPWCSWKKSSRSRMPGWPSCNPSKKFLKEEVDEEDIAEVVAKWTGIPVSKMLEGEVQKLVHMEDRLRERVLGQDAALEAVSNAIRRARAGLQDAEAADGFVYFPGPHRRRENRTGARPGGVPVRRRTRHGAHRHVGVHGKALGGAPDRRASRDMSATKKAGT